MENESLKTMHRLGNREGAEVFADDAVFYTAIGTSVTEVEGIQALADLNTDEPVANLSQRSLGRALRLDFDGDKMTVLVGVILSFDATVPEVSKNVRTKIICTVANMIGYTVEKVNIRIADVMI